MRSKVTEQREQRVARQIEVLLRQEEALDRRRDDLREREDRIVRLERELDHRRRQVELEVARRTSALDEREARIAARERELDVREEALDKTARKKARSLAQEAVSLAERHADVSRREAVAAAPPVDESAQVSDSSSARHSGPDQPLEDTAEIAVPAAEPNVPPEGWNLNRLERLVNEQGSRYPTRVDEWRYYLVYLREFADAHGNLPRPFDWLVWNEFEELVAKTAA